MLWFLVKTSSLLQLARMVFVFNVSVFNIFVFNIFILRQHEYVFHLHKHMNIQYPSARNMLNFLLIVIIVIMIIIIKWEVDIF